MDFVAEAWIFARGAKVIGTFGYDLEFSNGGLLNQKSDAYNFMCL